MTPQDFIAELVTPSRQSATTSGIPASFTIAEAALESGWGMSALAMRAKNLFGVKADPGWNGDYLEMSTIEYVNGKPVTVIAKWRKYDSWLHCLTDHAAFLHENERYAGCFAHQYTGPEFAIEVARAGYSTDPQYAEKVTSIIHQYNLTQYDMVKS